MKNYTTLLNPFSSCGTTKNMINFFPQTFVEKVEKKLKQEELTKVIIAHP